MHGRAQIPEAAADGRISKSAQIRRRRRLGHGRSERPTFSAGWRHHSSSFGLVMRSLGLGLRLFLRNCDGQSEEVDKSFRVFWVVASHGEAGEIRAIK